MRQRVFVVDPHALMRRAATEWINRCDGLTVCGMAGGVAKASEEIKRLQPDIVVTEIMPPRDLGFVKELHRRHPRLPILVFTTQEEALYRERAEEAGASGYLMKEAGGDRFIQSIHAVLRRQRGCGMRKVLKGGVGLGPTLAAGMRRKGAGECRAARMRW